MPLIERLGSHTQEDWAIRMFASNISDELTRRGFIVKKEIPYFNAIMSAIGRHPDLFRRSGYSIGEMRFTQHSHDKNGKVVSCVADFGGHVPTDEAIALVPPLTG